MGRPQPSTSHYPWHALAMISGRKQVQIKDTSTDEDAVPEANAFNYALLSVPVRVAHRPGIIRRICSFGSSYLLEHPPKSKQFAGYFTGCRVLACGVLCMSECGTQNNALQGMCCRWALLGLRDVFEGGRSRGALQDSGSALRDASWEILGTCSLQMLSEAGRQG